MRIFQTFILPETLVAKHKLSFAAVNFSKNLISGGGFDKVYSLIPTSVSGELGETGDDGYEVVYSTLRGKGHILSKLAIFVEQWHVFRHIKSGDSVWFYNMNMLNGLLFILLHLFKHSVKRNIIVLDFTPAKNWREQNWFFLKLINRASGTITLSTSDLFTYSNTVCLPGVVPAQIMHHPKVSAIKPEFLISGVLAENISQLRSLLIPAFKEMPNCTLHITGMADDEDGIKASIKDSPNIIYHGKVTLKEYFDLLDSIPFLLSTRNPHAPENKCNFPSKIIEALLHNRIVVSTMDYPQLGDLAIKTATSERNTFINEVQAMLLDKNIIKFANQGEKVKLMFSPERWYRMMTEIEAKS